MQLENVLKSKLKELRRKRSREEESLFYLFKFFTKNYYNIKKAYENDFKEKVYNDKKLFDKFYKSINKLLKDYIQDAVTSSSTNKDTPETKLGLICLEKVPSTHFGGQSFAYKHNLTDYAKEILKEYAIIKEAKSLDDLKTKEGITIIR